MVYVSFLSQKSAVFESKTLLVTRFRIFIFANNNHQYTLVEDYTHFYLNYYLLVKGKLVTLSGKQFLKISSHLKKKEEMTSSQ